jgi:hypothetical protein
VLKRNGWIGKTYVEKGLKENIFENQTEKKTQNQPLSIIKTKVSPPKQEIQGPKIFKTDSPDEPEKNKSPKRNNLEGSDESPKEKPAGCNHHFGYLSTLPKGKTIPDECYCCSKLIECNKEKRD